MTIRLATQEDYGTVLEIWRDSLLATHNFIPPDYVRELQERHSSYLNTVNTIYLYCDEPGNESIPKAFLAIKEDKIDLLFVGSRHLRRGIGRKLVEFALGLGYAAVDCYEANVAALQFYLKNGFEVVSRSELDCYGYPYPLLHLQKKAQSDQYCKPPNDK